MHDDITLVLGLGNTLLTDEGAGVRVMEYLNAHDPGLPAARLLDGGTLGLALLPEMEDAARLIVIDAALMKSPPGTVKVFEGEAMDAFLRARGRSPHDIGLDDLMDALRLRGRLQARRALVGIEPQDLSLGDGLSAPVQAAIPQAARATAELVRRWAAP